MAAAKSEELAWARGEDEAAEEQRADTLARVRDLIKSEKRRELLALLKRWDPLDLLELITSLRLRHARTLYLWLPEGPSLKVIAELRPEVRDALFEDETFERLVKIFDKLPAEEVAEALERLPDQVADSLIEQLRDSATVRAYWEQEPDTAGRIMSRKFLALPQDTTVAKTIKTIQENADLVGEFQTLYVVDNARRLIGRLAITRLLLQPADATLGSVMEENLVTVSPATDQEEALQLAWKRNLASLPVVDESGYLVGRITVKQLRRIMRSEAEEDMMLISGISPEADSRDSVLRIVKGRLPWLLAGLFGATIAAFVVGSFEEELQKAAILAAFIPVCMSMAGNSGLQASAVAVQGLANGTIWQGDTAWRLIKEVMGALINGSTAGLIVGALVFAASFAVPIEAPHRLAASVLFSLICVTTIAAVVGASVPLILDKIGIDPAMATGVFITTSNDVLGVLVFFLMATFFYF